MVYRINFDTKANPLTLEGVKALMERMRRNQTMAPNIKDMENRLNTLYWTDSEKYMELLDVIKGMGFKIYRNSKGKHRVQMDMSNAFGGIFKDFF